MPNQPKELQPGKNYLTQESFLSGLKMCLSLDKDKLFSPEVGLERQVKGLNIQDPSSWLTAVDWKQGQNPDLRLCLNNGFEISTSRTELPESVKDKVSKESLVYSLLLTEAKLKTVMEAGVPEAYALFRPKARTWLKQIRSARQEVLQGKQSGQDKVRLPAVKSGVLLLLLAAVGCKPLITAPTIETENPTQPRVTETATTVIKPSAVLTSTATKESLVLPTQPSETIPAVEVKSYPTDASGLLEKKLSNEEAKKQIEASSPELLAWMKYLLEFKILGEDVNQMTAEQAEKELRKRGLEFKYVVNSVSGGWGVAAAGLDGRNIYVAVDANTNTPYLGLTPFSAENQSKFELKRKTLLGVSGEWREDKSGHNLFVGLDENGKVSSYYDAQADAIVEVKAVPEWGQAMLAEVKAVAGAEDTALYELDGNKLMYDQTELGRLTEAGLVLVDPATGEEITVLKESLQYQAAVEMKEVHEDKVHIGSEKTVVSILAVDQDKSAEAGFPWATWILQEGKLYQVPEPAANRLLTELPTGKTPAEMSIWIRSRMPASWQEAPAVAYEASEHFLQQNYYLVKELMTKMGWKERENGQWEWQNGAMPASLANLQGPIGTQPMYLGAEGGELGAITPLSWVRVIKEGRELIMLSLPADPEGVRQQDGSIKHTSLVFNLTFDPIAQAKLKQAWPSIRTAEEIWTAIRTGAGSMVMQVFSGAYYTNKRVIELGGNAENNTIAMQRLKNAEYDILHRTAEANNERLSGCTWLTLKKEDLCANSEQKDVVYGWIITSFAVRGNRGSGEYESISAEDLEIFQQLLIPTIWAENY